VDEKIDWVEKQAAENLKFRLQNRETLAKEANNLLAILLAAIGAIVAFAIKNSSEGQITPLLIGAISMTGWLMLIATILVLKCIMTSTLIPPGNEPRNLLLDGYTLEQLKKFELDNVQNSIDQTASRNQNIAYWLDKARLSAVASPLVFILVLAFGTYLENLCALAG
jgi:hypothetical protein